VTYTIFAYENATVLTELSYHAIFLLEYLWLSAGVTETIKRDLMARVSYMFTVTGRPVLEASTDLGCCSKWGSKRSAATRAVAKRGSCGVLRV